MLQSTSLLRGKTGYTISITLHQGRFNPLPSCEGRRNRNAPFSSRMKASIHFPLAREDFRRSASSSRRYASIHFPLAREDLLFFRNRIPPLCASIHFPLAREDQRSRRNPGLSYKLQSTSLLRGKTCRSGCERWRICASIHFPLAREDSSAQLRHPHIFRFNPLPSCEGRPQISPKVTCLYSIILYISTI